MYICVLVRVLGVKVVHDSEGQFMRGYYVLAVTVLSISTVRYVS